MIPAPDVQFKYGRPGDQLTSHTHADVKVMRAAPAPVGPVSAYCAE